MHFISVNFNLLAFLLVVLVVVANGRENDEPDSKAVRKTPPLE
jgi:hypothetical protein